MAMSKDHQATRSPLRRRVWPVLRERGGPVLLLATLVFAAALAGRAPVWIAAPIGLATAAGGMAFVIAAGRDRGGAGGAEAAEAAPAHLHAAALCGHVLLIVLVVAVVINAAQGWITSFPWFQLLLVGAGAYVLGLLWYRRRSHR
jgi:hypothetical protein